MERLPVSDDVIGPRQIKRLTGHAKSAHSESLPHGCPWIAFGGSVAGRSDLHMQPWMWRRGMKAIGTGKREGTVTGIREGTGTSIWDWAGIREGDGTDIYIIREGTGTGIREGTETGIREGLKLGCGMD